MNENCELVVKWCCMVYSSNVLDILWKCAKSQCWMLNGTREIKSEGKIVADTHKTTYHR